ncbi:THAP domain-containing protein 2-like [Gigantopelta aegis]|uniref:THAP domain-containing protein 2-like n=1 Tax=Gigantopelta aegis TaxID=1735272 RepID=UPI001B88D033|nr:THAP domain-containing protein 2-like [Gigantopelta aegis]
MVISCVVVGCTHRFRKDCGIKFHRIPLEAERRAKWLQAINRKQWTPSHSGDRVCGVHFISATKTTSDFPSLSPTQIRSSTSSVKTQTTKTSWNLSRLLTTQIR